MVIKRIPSTYSSFSEATVIESGRDRWIYVSGQVGMDASGKVTETDFEREAELCFQRVRNVLERCGARMQEVVRITAYLTDLSKYAGYARARASAFGDALPASAAVQVAGLLANASIEIDAVAFVSGDRGERVS